MITFQRTFDARHREAVPVAPGVIRVTADNPGPLTFTGTNSYVVGTGPVAVIDPGPDLAEHRAALLTAIGGREITAIVLTHTHRDHAAGARNLAIATRAPLIFEGPHRPANRPRPGEAERMEKSAEVDLEPDRPIGDGETIACGDLLLRAIATPGHTANHMAFAIVDSPILFSGDHVMGWSTTVIAPPDGSLAAYLASLDTLVARPERRYLPGHGDEIEDGPGLCRGLKKHRLARDAAILDCLKGEHRLVSDIVARIYPGLSPTLKRAAALSVLAHLDGMRSRGAVLVDDDAVDPLTATYSLA